MEEQAKTKCGCFCHKMHGILVALIGLVFLLGAFDVLSPKTVNIAWPILLILIGLKCGLCQGKCKCCSAG